MTERTNNSTSDLPHSPRVVASVCTAGQCPTVYQDADGTLLVQGYEVVETYPGIDVPAGEFLVRIPEGLIRATIGNLI